MGSTLNCNVNVKDLNAPLKVKSECDANKANKGLSARSAGFQKKHFLKVFVVIKK